jgi:hypothetical protein
MRVWLLGWVLLVWSGAVPAASAADARVVKVLPHFLDQQGRHSLSPSLFDRDAYQAVLRQHPERRSGMRFDVEYKAKRNPTSELVIRVELRGIAEGDLPRQTVLEERVRPTGFFGRWARLSLTGPAYRNFGEVTAWRVTLRDGNQTVAEEHSFLW